VEKKEGWILDWSDGTSEAVEDASGEPAPEEPRVEIESEGRPLEWETLQLPKDFVPQIDRRTPVPPLHLRRPAPLVVAALALCASIVGGLAGRRAAALAGVGPPTPPALALRPPAPLDPVGPLVARAMALRDEGSPEALAAARGDLAEALRLRPGDSRALGPLATLEAEDALRAIDEALDSEAADLADPFARRTRSLDAWEQASESLGAAQGHAEAALRDPAADARTWLAVAFVRALQGRRGETTEALIMAGDGPESDVVRKHLAERSGDPPRR
jgi:hypothetical protein